MASLNFGLLSGLIGSGWLTQISGEILLGAFVCTLITGIVFLFILVHKIPRLGSKERISARLLAGETVSQIIRQYPVWLSVIILLDPLGTFKPCFLELGLSGSKSQYRSCNDELCHDHCIACDAISQLIRSFLYGYQPL